MLAKTGARAGDEEDAGHVVVGRIYTEEEDLRTIFAIGVL